MGEAFEVGEGGGDLGGVSGEELGKSEVLAGGDGEQGGFGVFTVMLAWDGEAIKDLVERGAVAGGGVRDAVAFGGLAELGAVGVGGVINTGVGGLLVAGDVGLSGEIVGVVGVDVEVVGLDVENDGDMRRALEVPELEAAELVNDEVGGADLVEDVEGGMADVADQPDSVAESGEEIANESAGGAFALGAGDADDAGGGMGEEILGDAGPIAKRRDGRAAENEVIVGEVSGFEVGGGDGVKNCDFGAARAEVVFDAMAFFAVAEDGDFHGIYYSTIGWG